MKWLGRYEGIIILPFCHYITKFSLVPKVRLEMCHFLKQRNKLKLNKSKPTELVIAIETSGAQFRE